MSGSTVTEVTRFVLDVRTEYVRVTERHGRLHSPHQGWAEILEELDELWEQVRQKRRNRDLDAMYTECVQIAARAMKFAIDLCLPTVKERD